MRHRATLVALRSHGKAKVHAVLATYGIQVPMGCLLGIDGTRLLDHLYLPVAYAARVASHRLLLETVQLEIDVCPPRQPCCHRERGRRPQWTAAT